MNVGIKESGFARSRGGRGGVGGVVDNKGDDGGDSEDKKQEQEDAVQAVVFRIPPRRRYPLMSACPQVPNGRPSLR